MMGAGSRKVLSKSFGFADLRDIDMKMRFGECLFDAESRQLFRAREAVHLSPKAFELLKVLVESRPKAMSKAEIHERIWPATYVTDDSLARLVTEIRGAIGDHAHDPRFVRTVHGFGYAFCGDGAEVSGVPSPGGPSYGLIWEDHELVLSSGDNILGREGEGIVGLDSPTISRRHARIVISSAGATLEDLGSKNGTYVRDDRVTSPVRLADGDKIRVGSVVLTFRVWAALDSTQTLGSADDVTAEPPDP